MDHNQGKEWNTKRSLPLTRRYRQRMRLSATSRKPALPRMEVVVPASTPTGQSRGAASGPICWESKRNGTERSMTARSQAERCRRHGARSWPRVRSPEAHQPIDLEERSGGDDEAVALAEETLEVGKRVVAGETTRVRRYTVRNRLLKSRSRCAANRFPSNTGL